MSGRTHFGDARLSWRDTTRNNLLEDHKESYSDLGGSPVMRFGKIALAVAGVGVAGALAAGALVINDTPTSALKDDTAAMNNFKQSYSSAQDCADAAGQDNQLIQDNTREGNWWNGGGSSGGSSDYFYCAPGSNGNNNLWERVN